MTGPRYTWADVAWRAAGQAGCLVLIVLFGVWIGCWSVTTSGVIPR